MAAKLHKENQELRSLVRWLVNVQKSTAAGFRHALKYMGDAEFVEDALDTYDRDIAKKLDAINSHPTEGK